MPSESSAADIRRKPRPLEYAVLDRESHDLGAENARLRKALTYYAEGRYPDGGEIAREALGAAGQPPRTPPATRETMTREDIDKIRALLHRAARAIEGLS